MLPVEDEAPLAESLCAVLKAKGHRVDWVADGRIALRQLQLERYDAIEYQQIDKCGYQHCAALLEV